MQLNSFFQALFTEAQSYIEIRTILEDQVSRYFYSTSDLDRLIRDLTSGLPEFKDTNIYFGVCPRKERKGKEEDIQEIAALWIDLDCHNNGERIEKLQKLSRFNLRPSILVNSGNGFHIYWLLDKVYSIKNDSHRLKIKGYLKGLSKTLNGDHTFDLARILRVPGTKNLKDPENPLPVVLCEFRPDYRFTLQDFDPYWMEATVRATQSNITPVEIPDKFYPLLVSNPKIKATWEGERSDLIDQSPSAYDMSLANMLVIQGFTDGQIKSILRERPPRREKLDRDDYLNRTIGEARRVWGKK